MSSPVWNATAPPLSKFELSGHPDAVPLNGSHPNNSKQSGCCRSRCMKCILLLTVIVSVALFLFYPRPIKFSFPTDEWLDILLEEADNGQGIIWDSTDSSFVVDCEVPVGVKNENFFVPLNVDIEAEVFYPSSLDSGQDGVKIATTEKEVKVAANSKEEVLLPAQAHVIPTGADGIRMASKIAQNCWRCSFSAIGADCGTTNVEVYVKGVLDDSTFGEFVTDIVGDIIIHKNVEVPCKYLFGKA
ncbi:hypothetical protein TrST_g8081 [Triparma strigata]|uniref:Uncharacterized protein n=1 Tax=Triparma strigata TaxID=1606541 RepID=A0A9W7DRQ6_9STRA|nr:hypothetical protein TrST_g8081 [Triparma strigata]